MNTGTDLKPEKLEFELQEITAAVWAVAHKCQEDSMALVALLRRLEKLHREIRDGMLQASLPESRQALYALLKDIETEGGWPYIERMKLQSFLVHLQAEAVEETHDGALTADGKSQTEEVETH